MRPWTSNTGHSLLPSIERKACKTEIQNAADKLVKQKDAKVTANPNGLMEPTMQTGHLGGENLPRPAAVDLKPVDDRQNSFKPNTSLNKTFLVFYFLLTMKRHNFDTKKT